MKILYSLNFYSLAWQWSEGPHDRVEISDNELQFGDIIATKGNEQSISPYSLHKEHINDQPDEFVDVTDLKIEGPNSKEGEMDEMDETDICEREDSDRLLYAMLEV